MWVGLANIVKLPITINHLPARSHSEQDSAVVDIESLFTYLLEVGDMVPVEKDVPGLLGQAAPLASEAAFEDGGVSIHADLGPMVAARPPWRSHNRASPDCDI